jgi:hypothetical protein
VRVQAAAGKRCDGEVQCGRGECGREREREILVPAGRASVSEEEPPVLERVCVQEAGIADKAVPMALRFRGGRKVAMPILSIMAKILRSTQHSDLVS